MHFDNTDNTDTHSFPDVAPEGRLHQALCLMQKSPCILTAYNAITSIATYICLRTLAASMLIGERLSYTSTCVSESACASV